MSNPSKPKLRWYQYSLRSLLILVTLFGIACSWVAVKMREARLEAEAAEAIRKMGGSAYYDYEIHDPKAKPPGPDWVRKIFGTSFVSSITSVSVDSTDFDLELLKNLHHLKYLYFRPFNSNETANGVTNEGLKILTNFDQLEGLLLISDNITDEGLSSLRGLTNLKTLTILSKNITGTGLANLSGMKNLDYLALVQNAIDDEGLSHLPDLPHLQTLNLSLTKITDTGLKHLGKYQALMNLELCKTKIQGDGFKHLAGLAKMRCLRLDFNPSSSNLTNLKYLQNLQKLDLGNSTMNDDGLKQLKEVTQIAELNLCETKITDAGLESLMNMKNLRDLDLGGDEITDEGMKQLAKLHNLVNLDVGGTKITDAGLECLKDLKLKYLDSSATDVSEEERAKFHEASKEYCSRIPVWSW